MGKGRVVGKGTLDVLVKGKPPGHLGPLNQTSKNTDQPTTSFSLTFPITLHV